MVDLDDRRLEESSVCVVEKKCRTERGIYAPDWAVVGLRQKVPPAILRCVRLCNGLCYGLWLNLSELVPVGISILTGGI